MSYYRRHFTGPQAFVVHPESRPNATCTMEPRSRRTGVKCTKPDAEKAKMNKLEYYSIQKCSIYSLISDTVLIGKPLHKVQSFTSANVILHIVVIFSDMKMHKINIVG